MSEPLPGPARLEIDLAAVAANWRALAALAAPAVVAGVVKADAYGLGAARVAPALWAAGCRDFFVARAGEGVALRRILPGARIFVLDGLLPGTEQPLAGHRLVPVLNQPDELARWRVAAAQAGRRLPAALQLDTGMCRLGFSAAQAAALDESSFEGLAIELVMSHPVIAEEAGHPLNERQRQRFAAMRHGLPAAPASLANSSGIFLGRGFQLDLCRPGVALYGANPTPGRPNPMRPVVRLEAPVMQVHDIVEEGSVGYGATWPTRPGARIATLPVGYADGYPRSAGNQATARIDGVEVPVAGRVSMDLTTLDVSSLPEGAVRPGSVAELIGGPDGLDRLADAAGTIPYEILTRLGARYERCYLDAEAPA
ncbi:alanine racemase [Geminicoccaceae bacterium 1502E]|nr:alanine racemase [Geminicoccaceae bacterium 1502E]